ncbi:embryonic ectoderm development protein [Colletotrichum truncatum]|uniref:Embryonic ectoderm development protein n=1 Tax=Colletotrichum truncatum TaxID=5467 RepID=A0ACC3ZJB0_COLTU|nr:embryonic ectoderm development protein [Colletotrichum truncatum]KAF6782387.1 embryonic ectoderm development protein [Colletotrichum truncatum]
MAPTTIATPYDFPRLRVSVHLEDDTRYLSQDDTVPEFFDVKFCPYQPLDARPIFAAVSKKHIVVCRLTATADDSNPCEIISIIRDDDPEARNYYCTWTRDAATGKPLLCYGGEDAKIKVYDIIEDKLVNCLVGHGGDICDVATSPIDPLIIASCSDDTTVRIWSLDPKHEKQPCLCILGGEGHYWNLLTLAWHDTGRYILSAGHDQIINLWTVPDLPIDPTDRPVEVHYPHFSTSEVHSSLVDCVAFFGDYVLSRACHDDVIVLWKIEGFSSLDPPPPQSMAPTTINPGNLTRSAFNPGVSTECPAPYTRLIEFHTPGCGPQFFMRFKLHFVPDQHPILAFCNANGKIFFWDFEQITGFNDYVKDMKKKDLNATLEKPNWLSAIVHRSHGGAKAEPTVREKKAAGKMYQTDLEQTPAFANTYNKETLQTWDSKYNVKNPQIPLRAHKVENFGASTFVGRQVAWSPGGEWCVVVGSSNFALVLQRWAPKRET